MGPPYRYFKDWVYTIWVHGALGLSSLKHNTMPKRLSPVASLHVRHPTPNLQVAFARAHSQNRNTLSFIPTVHSESLNPKFTYFQTHSKVGLWDPRHYVGPLSVSLCTVQVYRNAVYIHQKHTYVCIDMYVHILYEVFMNVKESYSKAPQNPLKSP